MNRLIKIGVGMLVGGILLSLMGTVIYALSDHKDFGNPTSYEEIFEENIESIYIDVVFLDFTIKTGDEIKLVAEEVPESLVVETSVDDKELRIESKGFAYKNIMESAKIGSTSYNIEPAKYILYLPSEKLDEFEVKTVFGSMKISEIECDDFKINTAYGYCKLIDINTSTMIIDSSFSSFNTKNVECNDFELANVFGDTKNRDIIIKESGEIDCTFGNAELSLIGEDYNVKATTVFGSADKSDIFENKEGKIKIIAESAFGSVKVTD